MTESRKSIDSHLHSDTSFSTSLGYPSTDEQLALIRLQRIANIPASILEDIRKSLLDEGISQDIDASVDLPKETDLRVRQLVQGGAPWQQIFEILWTDYEDAPSQHKSARLMEIAFVHASPAETLKAFEVVMTERRYDFYWLLHPRLRDFLVENMAAHLVDTIYWLLGKERKFHRLSCVEVLFMFLRASEGKDKAAAWHFYENNAHAILESVSDHDRFSYSRDRLILKIGELALEQGHDAEAKDVLNRLPRTSSEREQALEILLQYDTATLDRSKNSLAQKLGALSQWPDRIRLMDELCQMMRVNGGIQDPNRASLNIIVKSALDLVPKIPDAWKEMGEFLLKNRDMTDMLPAIVQTYYDHSSLYHSEELDMAFWSAALQLQPETPQDAYLSGLAWLHYFVTHSRRSDTALWTAQKMVDFATANLPENLPMSWRELVRVSLQYVEKAQKIPLRDRQRIASALRISIDGASSSGEVIQQYITLSDAPSSDVVDNLSHEAWHRKNYKTFIDLSLKTANSTVYRNSVLRRLWTASAYLSDCDLAWRLASVMASRESLDPRIKQSWSISGERRSVYAPTSLEMTDIECILNDFPKKTRRVLHNLFILGHRISELAEFTKKSTLSEVGPMQGVSATEKAILKSLVQSKLGLPQTVKNVFEAVVLTDMPADIAGVLQSPESNPWLFTTKVLFERLGMVSWGYRRQTLMDLTTSVLPMIGMTSGKQITAKLGKWLGSLTSNQRSAWTELSSGLSEVSDEDFAQDLLQFVLRVATLVYPSHFEALRTLQKSRVSLETVRRMECFVLSPTYSAFRKRTGTLSRVMIPKSLMLDDVNESDK